MKVLIVMPSGKKRGGAEEALCQAWASAAAAEQDWGCVVLERGELAAELKTLGGSRRVVELDAGRLRQPIRFLRTILAIRRLVREGGYDLVLGWMTKAHLYGGLAAWLAGRPAGYFQMGLPDRGRVDRLSRGLPAAGAIGCSRFVAGEQGRLVSYPVFPVPLAADLKKFARATATSPAETKKRLGFDPARPLVGIVGRLQHWKGLHVFAEAIALVAQHVPEIQAVIVGGAHDLEPGYEPWLRQRVAELGLADRLRFAGAQSNPEQWMQAMDVFVHASDREPFGIVVVEAMALGKPVIATIPGGPEEIIAHGVNGLLVPQGDARQLAAALQRFLGQPAFAAECGRAAYQRARDFSVERYVQNLVAALQKIAAASRPSS